MSDAIPVVHRATIQPTALTTLQTDDRCPTCAWPETCTADRTCWHQEARQPWQRIILDLAPSGKGRNST